MKAILLAAVAMVSAVSAAQAEETNVAVAANFTAAAQEIAELFHEETGHTAVLSFGSTGQLYTQIAQDAPFTVFLAADDARPRKAVEEGLAVEGTQFTYAVGGLVLFSRDADRVTGEETLRTADFERLAIANPTTAPYGAAAVQTMRALGVYDMLEPRIVQGNNIAQALQFVATGNAELGFVAMAQVIDTSEGSRWIVPEHLHEPIRQDAVLLTRGAEDEAAKAFLDFLMGPEAGEVIARYGYGTDAMN